MPGAPSVQSDREQPLAGGRVLPRLPAPLAGPSPQALAPQLGQGCPPPLRSLGLRGSDPNAEGCTATKAGRRSPELSRASLAGSCFLCKPPAGSTPLIPTRPRPCPPRLCVPHCSSAPRRTAGLGDRIRGKTEGGREGWQAAAAGHSAHT